MKTILPTILTILVFLNCHAEVEEKTNEVLGDNNTNASLYDKILNQAPEILKFGWDTQEEAILITDKPYELLFEKISILEKKGYNFHFQTIEKDGIDTGMMTQPKLEGQSVFIIILIDSKASRGKKVNMIWSSLLGQILYIEKIENFKFLNKQLSNNNLTKTEYVEKISRLWLNTAADVKLLFIDMWKPWALKRGCFIRPIDWFHFLDPDDFEAWKQIQVDNGNIALWEAQADKIIASLKEK